MLKGKEEDCASGSVQYTHSDASCFLHICWSSQWTCSPDFVCSVAQSCLTLCSPADYSPPGSSVHGIFQARIPEWVAISFSKGSSQPRDLTHTSCIGRWVLYLWATWETLNPSLQMRKLKPSEVLNFAKDYSVNGKARNHTQFNVTPKPGISSSQDKCFPKVNPEICLIDRLT